MAAHRTIHSITTLLALGGTTLCPHPRPFTGVDTTARASASGELLTTAATLTAKVTPAVRTPLRHPTSKDQPSVSLLTPAFQQQPGAGATGPGTVALAVRCTALVPS